MRISNAGGYSLVVERDVANVKAGFRLPLPAPIKNSAFPYDRRCSLLEKAGDNSVSSGDKGQCPVKENFIKFLINTYKHWIFLKAIRYPPKDTPGH